MAGNRVTTDISNRYSSCSGVNISANTLEWLSNTFCVEGRLASSCKASMGVAVQSDPPNAFWKPHGGIPEAGRMSSGFMHCALVPGESGGELNSRTVWRPGVDGDSFDGEATGAWAAG